MRTIKCDRCGKEKKNNSNFFDVEDFEVFDETKSNLLRVEKPHLCHRCARGYNRILADTNREIKKYLKNVT